MARGAARRHRQIKDAARRVASLGSIKDILLGLTTDFEREPASSAVPYAVSLAEQARAHLSIVSTSLQLGLNQGGVYRFAQGLVDAERAPSRFG